MTELSTTENKPKGQPPIIRGYTPSGKIASELTLWLNTPDEGEEYSEKRPDFRGHLQVGPDKHYVSAWAYAAGVSKKEETLGKEYPPFLSVAVQIKHKDGSFTTDYLEGSVRGEFFASVGDSKIEVDGSKGLKIQGKLTGKTVLTEGVRVSGYINGRFPDQQITLDLASSMGFKDSVTAGFKSFIEKDPKKNMAMSI